MDTTFEGDRVLVWGSTGWIGSLLVDYLVRHGATLESAQGRMEDVVKCAAELDSFKPTYVLCAAGLTGTPNVDWCEDHREEVLTTNVVGTLNLAQLCAQRGLHLTLFGTGCVYTYDDQLKRGVPVHEYEPPNFFGSFYSLTKGHVQALLGLYNNVLLLRLRMPVSDDLNPKNFITKITKYSKVVNIPNSCSILYELLPLAVDMSRRRITGTFNFVNPGAISHNEVLDMYREYIDPLFAYENFTEEDQRTILKAGRSNIELSSSRLQAVFPDRVLMNVKEAYRQVFKRMQDNIASNTRMRLP